MIKPQEAAAAQITARNTKHRRPHAAAVARLCHRRILALPRNGMIAEADPHRAAATRNRALLCEKLPRSNLEAPVVACSEIWTAVHVNRPRSVPHVALTARRHKYHRVSKSRHLHHSHHVPSAPKVRAKATVTAVEKVPSAVSVTNRIFNESFPKTGVTPRSFFVCDGK